MVLPAVRHPQFSLDLGFGESSVGKNVPGPQVEIPIRAEVVQELW